MADEEVIEPTQVIALDDLPPELRAEKQKRDINEALRKWRDRRDFMARHTSPKSIFKDLWI